MTNSEHRRLVALAVALISLPVGRSLGAQEQSGTLSGTVINSASTEPVARAQITLESGSGEYAFVASSESDDRGAFMLRNVPFGRYRLKASRNGYLDTYYGAVAPNGEGNLVNVYDATEMKDLRIAIFPYAVLGGRVFDNIGEPLSGITATLFRITYEQGVQLFHRVKSTSSDDTGQFRFGDLTPGKYEVRMASPASSTRSDRETANAKVGLSTAVFPPVPFSGQAAGVSLVAGARNLDLNIVMSRIEFHQIRGSVVNTSGSGIAGVTVGLRCLGDAGLGCDAMRADTDPAGRFAFYGVQAGKYALEALFPDRTSGRLGKAYSDIEVLAADVEGVKIPIGEGARVSGRITVDSAAGTTLTGGYVLIRRLASGSQGTQVASDGHFEIGDFPPDRYDVFVTRSGMFVKSLRSGNIDVLREGLRITGAGVVGLDIVLSDDGGRATGLVQDADMKLVSHATVVVVPEQKLRFRWDRYLTSKADEYGRFDIKAIAPGEYKVFAWRNLDDDAWYDPDFLAKFEQESVAISIKAGETVSIPVGVCK